MQPKKIRRVTSPLETTDKANSFVGVIDGKVTLVNSASGFDDEAMMTGEVDVEALRESGMTDEQIADAQAELEERILDTMIGDSAKAYTIKIEE